MNVQPNQANAGLFYEDLIRSYVDTPRFVERPWLATRIGAKLADPGCRFLLLTAEPGAGKTGFMAWLAHRHPAWPRYFIRRDQVSPLGPPSARSLLLQVGLQLAALHPQMFSAKQAEITISQRIGRLGRDATAIGAEVERLIASPFMQAAFRISQEVEQAEGQLKGLHVQEWISDPRLIPIADLQYLALIDPATTWLRDEPEKQIVILVDALDEVRYQHSGEDLLHWLANLPPLPGNIRFVLTSRPDDELLRTLREKQAAQLAEIFLDITIPELRVDIEGDLSTYARRLARAPALAGALERVGRTPAGFVDRAVSKAGGNLGYLNAIGRMLDQAQVQNDTARLMALAQLDDLPPSLEALYAFFLHQVKDQVRDRSVAVEDPQRGDFLQASAWPAVYDRILGVLSVAREPLTPDQIQRFGHIQAGWSDFVGAIDRLRQFLDEENGGYRFYHTTFPEFLTRPATRMTPQTRDLYQEAAAWHRRIVHCYQQLVGGWSDADWALLDDYGWRHLTAHADQAGREQRDTPLFDVCDAGFLLAKREFVTSVAALEEDWHCVLQACRMQNDFARFVHYGLQRSHQYTELAYLQTARLAGTAARLAVRRQDVAAVERLVVEVALIPHPLARISAERALLEVLIETMPAHPAVDALDRRLDVAMASLPPGEDRDRYLASYMSTLVLRQGPGWGEIGARCLDEVTSMLPRISLLATLSRGYAAQGEQTRALTFLRQALAECRQLEVEEDIVPDILEAVFGAQRTDPARMLAAGLQTILETAPVLRQPECVEIVGEALEQCDRLADEIVRVQLTTTAVQALDAAGLPGEARGIARELLDAYLQQELAGPDEEPVPEWAADAVAFLDSSAYAGESVALLALLPVVVLVGEATDLDTWRRRVAGNLEKVNSAPDLLWVARVTSDLTGQANVAPVLRGVLQQIGAHAQEITSGEVGFAIAATLAAGYARVGEQAHAQRLLTQIFDQVSAASLGPAEYPEQAQGRAGGFLAAWETACHIGAGDLLYTTLDWLVDTIPYTLPRDQRAGVWVDAITALEYLSDLDLASNLLDRLKLLVVEVMDTGGYLATACLQFADAYIGLSAPQQAHRLLAESVQVARETLDGEFLVSHLARTAQLYARLDDPEAGADLLRQALGLIPAIEGDNIQADSLQSVLPALGILADGQESGREMAAQLLEAATHVAESIVLQEYAVLALSAIVRLGVEHDLSCPTRTLARMARQYLHGDDANRLRAVVQAVYALHLAGADRAGPHPQPGWRRLLHRDARTRAQAGRDARQLLGELEHTIVQLPHETDYERAAVCSACADLVRLHHAFGEADERWRELATSLAQQVQEPEWRADACLAMVRIEAQVGGAQSAGTWLTGGIAAWHDIGEWLYASSRLNDIFEAWAAIPDDEERRSHLDAMRGVLWRLPDLDQRDLLQARLALSFLYVPTYFRELAEPVTGQSGIDALLTALQNAGVLPEKLLPEMLYGLLEKSSRQPRGFFAGNTLLATQIATGYDVFPAETVTPVLETLEATIREIASFSLDAAR